METGGFTVLRESMNYSAPRLLEIFGLEEAARMRKIILSGVAAIGFLASA